MSNEIIPSNSDSPLQRFVAKLNLPQAIAGPAGHAISRLIAGAVEIPSAYLDGFVQSIRDKTAARTIVNREVASAAAKLASGDSDIIARAAHNLLAKEYRHQKNKEEIARKTIEALDEEISSGKGSENGKSNIDDDWLNVFERYAQDASSERLQGMWARILAGEIRRPKTFSLKTLRFVSELDQDIAVLFERYAPLICTDSIFTSESLSGAPFLDLMKLQDGDLISGVGGVIQQQVKLDDKGQATLFHHEKIVLLEGSPNTQVSIPAALLTNVGREIAKLIRVKPDLAAGIEIAKRIPKSGLRSISYAGFQGSGTTFTFVPAELLWKAGANISNAPPASS